MCVGKEGEFITTKHTKYTKDGGAELGHRGGRRVHRASQRTERATGTIMQAGSLRYFE